MYLLFLQSRLPASVSDEMNPEADSCARVDKGAKGTLHFRAVQTYQRVSGNGKCVRAVDEADGQLDTSTEVETHSRIPDTRTQLTSSSPVK